MQKKQTKDKSYMEVEKQVFKTMFESQARHKEIEERLKDQKGMLVCHYCQQAVQIIDKLNEEV